MGFNVIQHKAFFVRLRRFFIFVKHASFVALPRSIRQFNND